MIIKLVLMVITSSTNNKGKQLKCLLQTSLFKILKTFKSYLLQN